MMVTVSTPKAGGPYEIRFTDGEEVDLEKCIDRGSVVLFRSVKYGNACAGI